MKSPRILLLAADNTTETALPDGMDVPLVNLVEVRDSRSGLSFSNGVLTAREAGVFRIHVSAEAKIVGEFHVSMVHIERNKGYSGKGYAPLNTEGNPDRRIQASITKILELKEGERVAFTVRQVASAHAGLWIYDDTVFIEAENLGY